MTYFIFVLVISISNFASAAESRCSKFRGYAEADYLIQTRVFNPNYTFKIQDRLGSEELAKLLGYHTSHTLESQFQNADPNPTNMLLWYLGFSRLARELAGVCDPSQAGKISPYLNDSFAYAALAFCGGIPSKSNVAFENLWLAVMSFDAPKSEFEGWRDFATRPDSSLQSPVRNLTEMLTLLFLNPHFLLRK